MSVPRARTGNDTSGGNPIDDVGLSSRGATPAVLAAYPDHPPLAAHVNGCDHCLGWLLLYMSNYVMTARGKG